MRRLSPFLPLTLALVVTSASAAPGTPPADDAPGERLVERIDVRPDGQRGLIHTTSVSMHGQPATFVWGQHRGCSGRPLAPHVLQALLAAQRARTPVRLAGRPGTGNERCLAMVSFLAPMP